MKVAGGVLGIIGGALNAIFAYFAYAAAAVIGGAGQAMLEASGTAADTAVGTGKTGIKMRTAASAGCL